MYCHVMGHYFDFSSVAGRSSSLRWNKRVSKMIRVNKVRGFKRGPPPPIINDLPKKKVPTRREKKIRRAKKKFHWSHAFNLQMDIGILLCGNGFACNKTSTQYVVYLISKSDNIAQVKKESSHNGASRKKK